MSSSKVFNAGAVIGAFGSTKQRPVFTSPEIADRYRYNLLNQYDTTQAANQGDVSNYAKAIAAGTPQAQQFANEDTQALTNLINQYGSYDPMATRSAIREGDLASLDKQFTNLVDYGSAADKARMASLGLGGRASAGSYGRIQDQLRASRNLSPVLNTIYGNLGSDTSRITQDRYQNLMSQLGLMNQRAGLYDTRVANRSLMPSYARNADLQSTLANLGGISQGFGQNVAGWEAVPNGVARWGNAIGAVDQGLNSALDTYMSMYGGGMLGGSGAFGASGTTPSNQMPSMGNSGFNSGGSSNQALMAILQRMLQSGQGGSSYAGTPSYNYLGPGAYNASNIP